jgi:hypothetical protein
MVGISTEENIILLNAIAKELILNREERNILGGKESF